MFKLRWGICTGLLGLLALAAPVASFAEGEPVAEYRAQAEPICKSNVVANKRIFQGVKGEVKAGELKRASRSFKRAATAFGRTIAELAAVPQPPEYETKLGTWLELLRTEKGIIAKVGKALAAEEKHKAESLSVALRQNTNKANNAVLNFGFNYCRIEQSRFG